MFNTKKKILAFYAIAFLTLFLGAIIWTISIAKLEPDITVSYLFKKNIVLNLLLNHLVFLFFASCKKVGVVALLVALFALSSFSLVFPIVRSVKKKKIFPYNLIFIIFLGAYFFYSSAFFLFFGTPQEKMRQKTTSKVKETCNRYCCNI